MEDLAELQARVLSEAGVSVHIAMIEPNMLVLKLAGVVYHEEALGFNYGST